MTLVNYQWAVGGIVLGPGTPYVIEDVEGLGRGVRDLDQDRGNGDGATPGPELLEARTVILTLTVKGTSDSDCMTKLLALQAAWTARGTERQAITADLQWKHPGVAIQRLIGGRPRRFTYSLKTLALGWVKVRAEYKAPDPRVYADDQRTLEIDFGTTLTLPNDGDHPAPVWFDIYGAVTAPGLIRNEAFRFDLAAAVASGAYFRVRTDARTVTRSSDSANRYQDFSGTFLEVPPGGAVFRAVGTSVGGSAKVQAIYRDTWSG